MRPLLGAIIYLTFLCGASVSAGYFGLVWTESNQVPAVQETDGGDSVEESEETADKRQAMAGRAAVFLWSLVVGGGVYVVAHLAGNLLLRGGLAHLRAEPEPEELLRGLGIHLVAAALAASLGGLVGYFMA